MRYSFARGAASYARPRAVSAQIRRNVASPVDVPAWAEIVIEGRILPGVREPEGPFGEFPGYSTSRSTEHVFEVTAVTRRKDALFLDLVPGKAADHLVLCRIFREPHLVERFAGIGQPVQVDQQDARFHP